MSHIVVRAGFTSSLRFLAVASLTLTLLFLADVRIARGADTGPPFQAEVTVDQTTVHNQANRNSSTVGTLTKGAVVAVLSERSGPSGEAWASTPDGFVLAKDVTQKHDSWVAEVAESTVMLYGKPYVASGVLRTAHQGDLVRVTGVAPGLEGDNNVWWATTVGYARLRSLRATNNEWAQRWTMPDPSEAPGGWWGSVNSQAQVRAGSTQDAPILGNFSGGERVKVLSEEQGQEIQGSSTWYRIDGGRFPGGWIHSSLVKRLPDPKPNTTAPSQRSGDSWIVVDRSAFTLTYVEGGQPKFVTYVALGEAGNSTPKGDYSILQKLKGDRMSSRTVPDASHPYDLPNVPFTQYFKEGGYAIHGTYWHDQYGTKQSQGCVNLTWTDGAYLFGLTQPQVPAGENQASAGSGGGTPVVILD